GEGSPDKNAGLPDATAGFPSLAFGHESFAVVCPLALARAASYPVSVRQPVASFPAAFGAALASLALRFPWVPVTKFPGGLSPPGQRPCWAYRHATPPESIRAGSPGIAAPRCPIERARRPGA